MHRVTVPHWSGEASSFNPAVAAPFKSGSLPVALGTLFENRSSSDQSPVSDGLREAVHEMFHALSSLLNEEPESAQACLQRAALALRLAPRSFELDNTVPKVTQPIIRGGLAPWQVRVLKTHIETHLEVTIQTKDLANLVQLSAFHFCRVFRVTFGHSPHSYVTRRRIERAQGLMLTTRLPLGQIAGDCGFADQSHFTKLFRRFAGESPGEWRKMRVDTSVGSQLGRAAGCDLRRSSLQASTSPVISYAMVPRPSPDGRSTETTGACNAQRTALCEGS
jgi:AraC family transcriptional regulator